jgi:AcrR family transcriptional regulator
VGPARTTITEIARRAGVQRPTVYANFPTDRELFAACLAHFMAEHPLPDLGLPWRTQSPWSVFGVSSSRSTVATV